MKTKEMRGKMEKPRATRKTGARGQLNSAATVYPNYVDVEFEDGITRRVKLEPNEIRLKPTEINNRGDLGGAIPREKTVLLRGVPYKDTKERTRARAGGQAPNLYLPGKGTVLPSDVVWTASAGGYTYREVRVVGASSGTGLKGKAADYSPDALMNRLRPYIIPSVFHNSAERYNAPRCYEGTRTAVLKEIMDWVDSDQSKCTQQFLWVCGPAGCGKSSIAQTVAELCEKEGRLASGFFFPSSSSARVTVVLSQNHDIHKSLVPTLAYQLVVTVPAIRPYIARAIEDDALIFSKKLDIQLTSLIVKPFTQLGSTSISQSGTRVRSPGSKAPAASTSKNAARNTEVEPDPHLIIIDALDECGQPESQEYILNSLSSAVQQTPAARLSFLISSRPEQAIRDAFNHDNGVLGKCTHHLVLDESYNSDKDIRSFLQSKFKEIMEKHPLGSTLEAERPLQDVIELLVKKACGQFVYASTVVKFVGSPRGRPSEQLKAILEFSAYDDMTETQTRAFAELDELYTNILMSIEEQVREKVLTVFAFLSLTSRMDLEGHYDYSFPNHPGRWANTCRTPAIVESFLEYEPHDLLLAFADLHSIVHVPPKTAWADTQIRLFHPFLFDFLHNRARSRVFFVDMGKYAAKFGRRCIDLFVRWLPVDDTLEGFNNSQKLQLAYRIFSQLFAWEYPDRQLIRDLTRIPVQLFIERLFHGTFVMGNFEFLPRFFKWLQDEDDGLHNEYNIQYDAYIKSRVISQTVSFHPRWKYIFTAITLKSDTQNFCNLLRFLDRQDEEYAFRRHFFPLTTIRKTLDTSDYLSRLARILTRPQPSREHQVPEIDVSSYAELGIEFFECMTVERQWMEPNWEHSVNWSRILDFFSAILTKIPGEPKLIEHLRQNRHRQFLKKVRDQVSDDWEKSLERRINEYLSEENHLPDTAHRIVNRDGAVSRSQAGNHRQRDSLPGHPILNNEESAAAGTVQQNGRQIKSQSQHLNRKNIGASDGVNSTPLGDGVKRDKKLPAFQRIFRKFF